MDLRQIPHFLNLHRKYFGQTLKIIFFDGLYLWHWVDFFNGICCHMHILNPDLWCYYQFLNIFDEVDFDAAIPSQFYSAFEIVWSILRKMHTFLTYVLRAACVLLWNYRNQYLGRRNTISNWLQIMPQKILIRSPLNKFKRHFKGHF